MSTKPLMGIVHASEFVEGDQIVWQSSTSARQVLRPIATVRLVPGGHREFVFGLDNAPVASPTLTLPTGIGDELVVLRGQQAIAPWRYGLWSIVDVESTGPDPETARICEVGVVLMRFGQVVDVWSSLIHPECPIPADATAIHGITEAMVADKPTIADVRPQIEAMLARSVATLGYNVWRYDQPLLAGAGVVFSRPVIDVLPLVRARAVDRDGRAARHWKSEAERREGRTYEGPPSIHYRRIGRHSLERVARELGVAGPERGMAEELHRAAWDAVLTGRGGWRLRTWLGPSAAASEAKLREEAARQDAETEVWRAKRDAERQAAAPASVEERIQRLFDDLAKVQAEQTSFLAWRRGAQPP